MHCLHIFSAMFAILMFHEVQKAIYCIYLYFQFDDDIHYYKMPTDHYGRMCIRDSTVTSCQKDSNLHINRSIIIYCFYISVVMTSFFRSGVMIIWKFTSFFSFRNQIIDFLFIVIDDQWESLLVHWFLRNVKSLTDSKGFSPNLYRHKQCRYSI